MFNPEALLGQLMGDALSGQLGGRKRKKHRSSGLGSLLGGSSGGMSGATKAKLGLGLLGIAVAAYQHYQQQPGAGTAPNPLAGAGTVSSKAGMLASTPALSHSLGLPPMFRLHTSPATPWLAGLSH